MEEENRVAKLNQTWRGCLINFNLHGSSKKGRVLNIVWKQRSGVVQFIIKRRNTGFCGVLVKNTIHKVPESRILDKLDQDNKLETRLQLISSGNAIPIPTTPVEVPEKIEYHNLSPILEVDVTGLSHNSIPGLDKEGSSSPKASEGAALSSDKEEKERRESLESSSASDTSDDEDDAIPITSSAVFYVGDGTSTGTLEAVEQEIEAVHLDTVSSKKLVEGEFQTEVGKPEEISSVSQDATQEDLHPNLKNPEDSDPYQVKVDEKVTKEENVELPLLKEEENVEVGAPTLKEEKHEVPLSQDEHPEVFASEEQQKKKEHMEISPALKEDDNHVEMGSTGDVEIPSSKSEMHVEGASPEKKEDVEVTSSKEEEDQLEVVPPSKNEEHVEMSARKEENVKEVVPSNEEEHMEHPSSKEEHEEVVSLRKEQLVEASSPKKGEKPENVPLLKEEQLQQSFAVIKPSAGFFTLTPNSSITNSTREFAKVSPIVKTEMTTILPQDEVDKQGPLATEEKPGAGYEPPKSPTAHLSAAERASLLKRQFLADMGATYILSPPPIHLPPPERASVQDSPVINKILEILTEPHKVPSYQMEIVIPVEKTIEQEQSQSPPQTSGLSNTPPPSPEYYDALSRPVTYHEDVSDKLEIYHDAISEQPEPDTYYDDAPDNAKTIHDETFEKPDINQHDSPPDRGTYQEVIPDNPEVLHNEIINKPETYQYTTFGKVPTPTSPSPPKEAEVKHEPISDKPEVTHDDISSKQEIYHEISSKTPETPEAPPKGEEVIDTNNNFEIIENVPIRTHEEPKRPPRPKSGSFIPIRNLKSSPSPPSSTTDVSKPDARTERPKSISKIPQINRRSFSKSPSPGRPKSQELSAAPPPPKPAPVTRRSLKDNHQASRVTKKPPPPVRSSSLKEPKAEHKKDLKAEQKKDPKAQQKKEPDTEVRNMFRGIQGSNNSCYIDATLNAMFSYSTVFDYMVTARMKEVERNSEDGVAEEVRKILRRDIVRPLRTNGFVPHESIGKFRSLLGSHLKTNLDALTDVGEFLVSLFELIKAPEPIEYNTGEKDFMHQILLPKHRSVIPEYLDVQTMLEASLTVSNVKFTQKPERGLIIKLPVSDGRLSGVKKGVIPNSFLTLKCGKSGKPEVVTLSAVICLRNDRFVCFAKIEKGGPLWTFMDSRPTKVAPESRVMHGVDEAIIRSLEEVSKVGDIYGGHEVLLTCNEFSLFRDTYICIYT